MWTGQTLNSYVDLHSCNFALNFFFAELLDLENGMKSDGPRGYFPISVYYQVVSRSSWTKNRKDDIHSYRLRKLKMTVCTMKKTTLLCTM